MLDLAQNRLAFTVTNKGGGFRGNTRIVVTGGTGQNFDLLNRTVTPIAAAGAQNQLAVYQRRLPSLILRTALQRAATLRYLGEDTARRSKTSRDHVRPPGPGADVAVRRRKDESDQQIRNDLPRHRHRRRGERAQLRRLPKGGRADGAVNLRLEAGGRRDGEMDLRRRVRSAADRHDLRRSRPTASACRPPRRRVRWLSRSWATACISSQPRRRRLQRHGGRVRRSHRGHRSSAQFAGQRTGDRGNQEGSPEQADQIRRGHAPSRRSFRRAARLCGRRRNRRDHAAERRVREISRRVEGAERRIDERAPSL